MINPFFKNYGPVNIKEIYKILEIKRNSLNKESKIFDITDVSNQKFKLAVTYAQNATAGRTTVDTNANRTYVIVTRLGDT